MSTWGFGTWGQGSWGFIGAPMPGARTGHRIANEQDRPVDITRRHEEIVLLPRRQGVTNG